MIFLVYIFSKYISKKVLFQYQFTSNGLLTWQTYLCSRVLRTMQDQTKIRKFDCNQPKRSQTQDKDYGSAELELY